MESFKIYLPSNASTDRFPDNSSSNFHTELSRPIDLHGKWEVGLESIFYSSKLGSKKEKGSLDINVKVEKQSFVHEWLPFRFRLTKDNTWSGYKGVQVKPPKEATLSNVLTTLNSANALILEDGHNLFKFSIQGTKIQFDIFSSNVYIRFSHKINTLLGNKNKHQYSFSTEWESKRVNLKILKTLTASDYSIQYFCPDILEQESIQYLNLYDDKETDLTQILPSFWEKKVLPLCGIKLEIIKNKVVLHHDGRNKGLLFSDELQDLMSQKGHLFYHDSRWGWSKLSNHRINPKSHYWVAIYSNKMKLDVKSYDHNIQLSMTPHMFDKVDNIVSHLNHAVNSMIKKKTGNNYHEGNHHFLFSQFNNRIKLTTGQWIHVKFDDNLCYILGFKENSFKEGVHEGIKMPSILQEREQLFYIEADFVQSIPFGIQKLPILREFIHDVTDDAFIIEKRFQPMSYIPVSKSYINKMHISIVDQRGKPIVMENVKTILNLHFRRVQ